jgi:hypothetical protein
VLPDYWKRVAGLHAEEDGVVGVVWLAIDDRSSVVHCYDAALFKIEVFPVIADSIHARGSWIPLAWRKEDEAFAKKLENTKINVLPEPSSDSPVVSEVASREIWLRMRGNRFKVDETCYPWLEEYKVYYRDESKVPQKGFPLMAATRHAIEQLSYAKAQSMPGSKKRNYPKVCIR